jgi:hypothetical protein
MAVLLLASDQNTYKMSTRTSTVYKYVKEHYPMAKDHRVAREHQVDNPLFYTFGTTPRTERLGGWSTCLYRHEGEM